MKTDQLVDMRSTNVEPVFVGIVALALHPSSAWDRVTLGTEWVTCLFCIPLFAIVPFALLVWALRKGAPTKRAGETSGLVAGALGAAAYAFHCSDDSLPFVAIWYGAMVVLCGWIGRMLGPRLLW